MRQFYSKAAGKIRALNNAMTVGENGVVTMHTPINVTFQGFATYQNGINDLRDSINNKLTGKDNYSFDQNK